MDGFACLLGLPNREAIPWLESAEALGDGPLVRVGTPGWLKERDVAVYDACMARGLPMAFYGVGTPTDTYEGPFDQKEALSRLGHYDRLADVVVRDRILAKRFADIGKTACILPCPGFYALEAGAPRTSKRKVVLDILPPSVQGFRQLYRSDYEAKVRDIHDGLRIFGAEVSVGCHGPCTDFEFMEWAARTFGTFTVLTEREQFRKYYEACDVYVGWRVHGLLPNAGRGALCYGFGIDQRQTAWAPVPFIEHEDVRWGAWEPSRFFDWYECLPDNPEALSEALLRFRRGSEVEWKRILSKVEV
jgi:hypothetical protein